MNHLKLFTVALSLAVLSGCSSTPSATEADFGNSVRSMVKAQTLNPGPADAEPVESTDGKRLENVLDTYRNDVAHPEVIQRDPTADLRRK